MRALKFIQEIFKRYPWLLIANTFLIVLVILIDAATVISLVAVIDLFLQNNAQAVSPITQKIMSALKSVGLPATIKSILMIFFCIHVLKVGFQIFAQYSIFKTKYAVLRDLMVRTFECFFDAIIE